MTSASWQRWIGPLLAVGLFIAALAAIHHQLAPYSLHQIQEAFDAIGLRRLALGMLLTVVSYFLLTFYDFFAVRYLGHDLGYGRTALASFVAYGFGHTFSFAAVASTSMRYRFYAAWGLPSLDVAKVAVLTSLTFWLGFLGVGGVGLLLVPGRLPPAIHLLGVTTRPLGVTLLAILGAYLLLVALRHGKPPLRFRGQELSLPGIRATMLQILLGSADWLLAASVLYVLLPGTPAVSFTGFVGVFLVAQIGGSVSQIPGGLGVFDSLVLVLLGDSIATPQILAALLAYRILYYLLPLLGAAAVLSVHAARTHLPAAVRAQDRFVGWGFGALPAAASVATFLSGVVLLLSGATPAEAPRLVGLQAIVPLPVIESSHLLASLTGASLLMLARGLQRRLDAAYLLTVVLLTSGIVFSLVKGFDYEEAAFLLIVLAILLPSRRQFYRRASLLNDSLTPGWLAAVGLVIGATTWLLLFAHKHVEYSNELWWRFSLQGDAPRSLRALAGVLALTLIGGLIYLLRPALPRPHPVTTEELARAREVVAASSDTMANLALLGDKSLLFSENGRGFVMYQAEGRSVVALGDPVAPEGGAAELAWRFFELGERTGSWTVFYQISHQCLPVYLDMGLTLIKLGEEARVELSAFTLQGPSAKSFRHTLNLVHREGGEFEILGRAAARSSLPALRAISDAWLASKNTREKGFSLGSFSEPYLENFDIAVIRRDEAIVAFANLWTGADREELSVDLMRFDPRAPEGSMEALFLEVMQWGKAQGFRWFNLGMAPLAGVDPRPGGPAWNRIAALVYRHGEHFYNFRGLRQYKEKFSPQWTPRYLAYPGGLTLPRVLLDIATLCSRGLKGVLGK